MCHMKIKQCIQRPRDVLADVLGIFIQAV
jgi:hypothetical protein